MSSQVTTLPTGEARANAGDSSRGPWLVLAVLVVAQLTVWLDNTILNVALKTLADPVSGVGASPSQLQWCISSYTLVFAALLFTGGALGDRFGHRLLLLVGLGIFGAASVWAAYAADADQLILVRGLMGVGSALVMPATLSIIARVFDPERRAKAIAVWSGSSGLAIAAGPLVGGALLEKFWWGSVFLVNLPFVVVALVAALLVVPATPGTGRERFDPAGVLLSAFGLLAVVYGVIEGGHLGAWDSWKVLGPIASGLVLLAAFVAVELRLRAPSFDVRMFGNLRFTGASVAVMLAFFGLSGSMFYAIFYLQGVRAMSPLGSGATVAPVALGVMIGAPLSAPLVRRLGIRAVVAPAMSVAVLTFYSYVFFDEHTPLPWFWLLVLVQGIALGAVMAPTTEAIMATLPPEKTGAGSAMNNSMRQLGGVLGVAVLGSVLSSMYRHDVRPKLAGLPDAVRESAVQSAEATRYMAGHLRLPGLVDVANASFIRAMHVTTVVGALVSLLAVLVIVFSFRGRVGRVRPEEP